MQYPALQFQNISKSFDNLPVLKNINLNVKKGEFVSIVGPSGCGKSTLLNIIAGVEKQSAGEVLMNGEKVNERKGRFGYMLQDPLLLPWRTVSENVVLGLDIRKTPRSASIRKAEELLREFGLARFRNYYPHALSGGMQQKVALLRTILFNSEFLLLDEPFASLDAMTRLSMQLWLLDVWKHFRSTVLFVTHDIREAILLSDRIYVLTQKNRNSMCTFAIPLKRPRQPSQLHAEKIRKLEQSLTKLLSLQNHEITV